MMLDFPFPGFPIFEKLNFSDVPALNWKPIIFGPSRGVIVKAIKNIYNYGFKEV